MAVEDLRKSDVMSHLIGALDEGKDIGHYGKFVFVTVARHFMEPEQVVEYLTKAPDTDEDDARSLLAQVQGRGYNPPRREKILQYQQQQDFPICPNPDDPDACNLYRDLQFPDDVYEDISEYYEHKADA
jgi:DNA primase large subunit